MGNVETVASVTPFERPAPARMQSVADEAVAAATRSRRYGRIELTIVACSAVLLCVAALIALYFGGKSNERDQLARHQDCVAQALVVYAAQTGDAFSSGDTAAAIGAAARDLRTEVGRC